MLTRRGCQVEAGKNVFGKPRAPVRQKILNQLLHPVFFYAQNNKITVFGLTSAEAKQCDWKTRSKLNRTRESWDLHPSRASMTLNLNTTPAASASSSTSKAKNPTKSSSRGCRSC